MTRAGSRSAESWATYLSWFHERRPGITEDVLAEALADESGTSPYGWLLSAIPRDVVVLDLACGSGPLLLTGSGHRSVGIDRSAGELRRAARRTRSPLVRGDAATLPFANETFDLVLCSMALMLFEPVDAALAEVRRVLIPRGIALFLLPGSRPLSARDRVRYARVLAALRELGPAYPNQVHLGRLPSRLSRASLSVLGDDRRRFRYRFGDERAARRFVESLYAPGRPPERIERAVQLAEGWVGSEIGIPLRRLVCQKHRQSDQLPGHLDQLSD